ncbi:MAG: nitroreductase family protein [Planctomycetota bacterium]|jgi:nitroreductase
MEVMEAIRKRRSIRCFERRKIPSPMLDALILALRWAPSAGNLQSRRFYFVLDPRRRRRLAHLALEQTFVAEAPLAVVACADHRIRKEYGERGVTLYAPQDVAASLQNLLLAAHAAGLGSCWVGAFDEEGVRRLLKLPRHLRPVAIVAVGFPREDPAPPARVRRRQAVVFVE